MAVSGVDKVEYLEFADRSARLLPTSKKITREIYQRLYSSVGPR